MAPGDTETGSLRSDKLWLQTSADHVFVTVGHLDGIAVPPPRKYNGIDGPRVAIAHDYLTQLGGAEKAVLAMSRAFPDAPIYTMLYEPSATYPEFAERDIRASLFNRLAPLRKNHRAGLPIFPVVAQSVFVDADIVLASSSGWAHGFRTRGRKLIYCYSPARWLYLPDQYLGDRPSPIKRMGLRATAGYLKAWDRRNALSCDRYLANSNVIKDRIADTYGITADVVFTPVAMSCSHELEAVPEMAGWGTVDGAYYVCVSRLLPYKNVDAVVRAFAGSDRRLVVVGKGPEAQRLDEMRTDNVLMLSDLADAQMAWLYKHCRAVVAASYEDFGLTPIEAGVWGRPSVALRFGGFLDTIEEGVTGLYFDVPEPQAIAEALDRFEATAFDAAKVRSHMEQFTEERFAEKLYAAVEELAAAHAR
jgi:glycosyltransferase involved in cell wall biosynthesis